MSSQRKIIRDQILSTLDGNITFNAQVVPVIQTRTIPILGTDVPAINFYILGEDDDPKGSQKRFYWREDALMIQLLTGNAPGQNDDEIDEILDQIEVLFFADDSLGGTADDIILLGHETVLDERGDKRFSGTIQRWMIKYRTDAPAPVLTLDDFLTENTKIFADADPDGLVESLTSLQ